MELAKIYKEAEEKTKKLASVSGETPVEIQILSASFLKCIDYNILLSSSAENSNLFYFLPMLRGLCEELIVFNYLLKTIENEDRKNFIIIYQYLDWKKSIDAQEEFFGKNKPNQPVLTKEILKRIGVERLKYVEIYNELYVKYSWTGNRNKLQLPSVFSLAEKAGFTNLYRYLYLATSRLVHFNPQTLFQMIWGEFETPELRKIKTMNISTNHFKKYYNEFCLFYGYYLLKIFSSEFSGILEIDSESYIKKLDIYFSEKSWPEIITFEEMNIRIMNKEKFSNFNNGDMDSYMSILMSELLRNGDNSGV